jgi:hypothetical protein
VGDLEIVRDFWYKIIFYLLGARFWKLLEEANKYAINFFSHLESSLLYQVIFEKLLDMLLQPNTWQ